MANPKSSTRSDFYVYALFRDDGRVFYIGKGCGRRLADHAMAARRGDGGYKNAIIRDMQARGVDLPRVKIHEGLTESAAHAYEVALIASIGRHPHGPLTNLTDGGEGFVGFKHAIGRKQSLEHIAKRVAVRLKRDLSPENIANMAEAMREKKSAMERQKETPVVRLRKKRSPESIAKGAKARRGKKVSPEGRANMSVAQRTSKARMIANARVAKMLTGRKQSAEHVEKVAATKRGVKQSPEHVAKRMTAHTGKTRSAEARANMAAAQRIISERRRAEALFTPAPLQKTGAVP